MSDPAIPEMAIRAFEETHQLRVTIHDLSSALSSVIPRDRFQHRHTLCRCVKATGLESRCVALEVFQIRQLADQLPKGRYHICHAGLVEWVMPVFHQHELVWTVFAGVRLPGQDFQPHYCQ